MYVDNAMESVDVDTQSTPITGADLRKQASRVIISSQRIRSKDVTHHSSPMNFFRDNFVTFSVHPSLFPGFSLFAPKSDPGCYQLTIFYFSFKALSLFSVFLTSQSQNGVGWVVIGYSASIKTTRWIIRRRFEQKSYTITEVVLLRCCQKWSHWLLSVIRNKNHVVKALASSIRRYDSIAYLRM